MSVKFKKDLVSLLQSHVDEDKPLILDWLCSYCHKRHGGNLFKKITAINSNVVTGEMKADIGLMTTDGKLFAAIHFSNNKKPIERAIKHYKA